MPFHFWAYIPEPIHAWLFVACELIWMGLVGAVILNRLGIIKDTDV